MSTFKNVSGEDRDVLIDGRAIFAAIDAEFTIPDEHDYSLAEQPHFELVKGKTSAGGGVVKDASTVVLAEAAGPEAAIPLGDQA